MYDADLLVEVTDLLLLSFKVQPIQNYDQDALKSF